LWITLFTSVTSTSLIGGRKHDRIWQKESIEGEPARKHLLEQCEISTNEVVVLFDPARLVYEVKSSSQTNVSGEISGSRIFRVEIGDVVSCTCITPILLHLPCSHVITACHMRHVLHEGSNQMSPYYSLSAEEKTLDD
jgi:hypothetical protein